MLVDTLLKYIGEYPSSFPTSGDKWSFVFANFHIQYFEPYFWIVMGLIPLLYLSFLKIKQEEITKKKYMQILKWFILMVLIGYFAPRFITVVIGGLAVRGIYGG